MLAERGASIVAYDPAVHVITLPKQSRLATSALDAASADVLLVLTEWPEFHSIPPHTYSGLIRRRVVIDGRNVLDGDRVAAAGLSYRGVGRAVTSSVQHRLLAAAL
jgi:UDPglucose 6-dehydrogenase